MPKKMPNSTNIIHNFEKGPITRSLFRNGATLLFHHAVGFSGARVNINFIAGSMFEKKEERGLAHLIEHLVFKEIETNYLKELEFEGAEINAYTYKENVCFEMSLLADKLEALLPKFIQLVGCLKFSDSQFRKEKDIVIQEIKEDLDDHESMGFEYLFSRIFEDALGHPIAGNISQLRKYKRQNVEKFYKKYFTAHRMIISVVSGVKVDSLPNLVEFQLTQLFGAQARMPFRLKASPSSKRLKTCQSHQKKSVESSILYLSFDGPSINSPNFYDYIVLDDLLFEGLSSRFFKKFREENAFVYGLGSSMSPFARSGCYMMVFNTQKKHLKAIEVGVRQVLKDIMESGIESDEMAQLKSRILDNWKIGLDSLDERLDLIQDNELYGLDEYAFSALQDKLDLVSSKTVQKLCKKLYTNDYSILTIQPKAIA